MTTKAEFNAEEWEAVVAGPPAAGLLVVVAARGGTLRESLSIAQAYAEARERRGQSALLDEIVSSQPAIDPPQDRSPEELRDRLLGRLRQAVEILSAHAGPEEVDRYRAFVVDVAERVAQAHKEGGFLGMGGTRVSDAEAQAIEDVRRAVGAASA